MQHFAWHDLRLTLPEDWELTLFGKDPLFGQLAFSTLEGEMAHLEWSRGRERQSRPDWQRQEHQATRTCGSPARRWTWTFSEPAAPQADAVLNSFRLASDNAYTLAGIRARVPEGFLPDKVTVFPANVMLSLSTPKGDRLVYRRWGLPHYVLQGTTPAEFLEKLMDKEGLYVEKSESTRFRGHDTVALTLSTWGLTPWARLRNQRAAGRAWIWLEPDTKRLCTFEQLAASPERLPPPEACFEKER